MSKLYEINIYVQLKDGKDHLKWMLFCNNNNYDKRQFNTMTGINSTQNLLSKWCRRSSLDEVIEYSKIIMNRVQSSDFNIIRTRIICHWSNTELDGYYECKFYMHITGIDKFNILCETLRDYSVCIGCNKDDIYVSLRMKNINLDEIIGYKDLIINRLKSMDLHISGRIIENKIVYDTNIDFDEGIYSD